jgi:FAD/FMN-containing dehydrogenase
MENIAMQTLDRVSRTDPADLDASAIAALVGSLRGQLIQPGDAAYDDARSVRNGLIDRRPALIARCSGVADVVAAVHFARERGLLLSIRGGGHNVAGNAVNDGGLVVDLSTMRGVWIDAERRTVRVQGGATWGDVDRETQLFGLATPGGVVSTTGVAGLTLHGGFGWLRRKHGYSVDNLLAVEIVTADGRARIASETENPDLFWAVRGSGSNFGVVTAFEFRLHPIGPVVAFAAPFYPAEEAAGLLPRWRDFMAAAPDEISSQALFWGVPAVDAFPVELHGRSVFILVAAYAGEAAEGERMMRPLRELATPQLDLSGTMPYATLQTAFDPFFPKGRLYYWKSLYLDRLDDKVVSAITGYAANRPSPDALMALWHLGGGAASRVPAEATAFGSREAPFMLSFDTTWTDPADTERNIAWTRAAWADMRRFGGGGLYLNFAGFGEEKEALVRAGFGANYDRLATLKAKYDPCNLFRMNQNIAPAVLAAAPGRP